MDWVLEDLGIILEYDLSQKYLLMTEYYWVKDVVRQCEKWNPPADSTSGCNVRLITEKICWTLDLNHTWSKQRILRRNKFWLSTWGCRWGTAHISCWLQLWYNGWEKAGTGIWKDTGIKFKEQKRLLIGVGFPYGCMVVKFDECMCRFLALNVHNISRF